MSQRALSPWHPLIVGGVIYLLLGLSLVLSFFNRGGWWSVVVAIGIAIVQALLIAWFSMELYASRRSVIVLALIAPLFLILLVALTAVDIYTRVPAPMLIPEIERHMPQPPP